MTWLAIDTLKDWLGDPELLIIDVRSSHAWEASDRQILGAVWRDPREVAAWGPALPRDKRIILY